MSKKNRLPVFRMLVVAAALCGTTSASVEAAPVKVEAVITPKTESRMEFADGSKRYLLATQREGKTAGNGPLAGATMLEWGTHDVTPGIGALGNGYLIFTITEGDIAYLKYQFRMISVPGSDGKPQNLINGFWEVAGGTGKLKGLQGAGTVHVNTVSPKERQWILEGDLIQVIENRENKSTGSSGRP
jgi:hypothetical protein